MCITDEQMRERMKEIDKQRNKLLQERREYESLLKEKSENKKYIEHKKCEGKCYKATELINHPTIKFLKILNVLDDEIDSAKCLCIFDGSKSWDACGLYIMKLSLWSYNDNNFIHKGHEPLMIDVCDEISQREFVQVFNKYITKFTDILYGEDIEG